MLHEDRARAQVFGSVAELYDASRPSYPSALIDDLVTPRPECVLDVGCGTGIAAALLAARGVDVLGIEPDPRMATLARAKGIEVEESSFEQWDSRGRRFALLTAAQSWHWVAPHAGADKAAEVLAPGGRVALFWNRGAIPAALTAALDPIYERLAAQGFADTAARRGRGDGNGSANAELLSAHPAFDEVHVRRYDWSQVYTTREWVDQLSTHSDHATLPEALRREVLDAVTAVVQANGGRVEVSYRVHCVMATRRTQSRSAGSTEKGPKPARA